jgi:hypothetical protein
MGILCGILSLVMLDVYKNKNKNWLIFYRQETFVKYHISE